MKYLTKWNFSRITVVLIILLATAYQVEACGDQKIIQVPAPATPVTTPAIIDAWTTNDINNPYNEVYIFNNNVDTLAFVTEYSHTGGNIPQQTSVSFTPGTKNILTKCVYNWTMPLPPGTYLLINYFSAVSINKPSTTRDWAAKVGNATIGWPDQANNLRPWPFTIIRQ